MSLKNKLSNQFTKEDLRKIVDALTDCSYKVTMNTTSTSLSADTLELYSTGIRKDILLYNIDQSNLKNALYYETDEPIKFSSSHGDIYLRYFEIALNPNNVVTISIEVSDTIDSEETKDMYFPLIYRTPKTYVTFDASVGDFSGSHGSIIITECFTDSLFGTKVELTSEEKAKYLAPIFNQMNKLINNLSISIDPKYFSTPLLIVG